VRGRPSFGFGQRHAKPVPLPGEVGEVALDLVGRDVGLGQEVEELDPRRHERQEQQEKPRPLKSLVRLPGAAQSADCS